jgi:hypothetical protein
MDLNHFNDYSMEIGFKAPTHYVGARMGISRGRRGSGICNVRLSNSN